MSKVAPKLHPESAPSKTNYKHVNYSPANSPIPRPTPPQEPQSQPHSQPPLSTPEYKPYEARYDEIDLFDLLENIWKGKWWVIATVLATTILGGTYAWLSTPIFQVATSITPAEPSQLLGINNSNLIALDREQAFQRTQSELTAFENFKMFYAENESRFELEKRPESNISVEQRAKSVYDHWLGFKQISQKEIDAGQLPYFEISMTFSQGIYGHELLNDYVSWTNSHLIQELKKQFEVLRSNEIQQNQEKMQSHLRNYEITTQAEIDRMLEADNFKRKELNDQLTALKQKLLKQNQQKIQLIEENVAIAKSLGIRKPTTPSDLKEVEKMTQQGDVFKAEFSAMEKLPLYFFGFEFLQAEKSQLVNRTAERYPSSEIAELERQIRLLDQNRTIEKLRNRKNPEMFVDDYLNLQKRNQELSSFKLETENVRLYTLKEIAVPPTSPIKPKKLLILALAIVAGGFLGIMLALIIAAAKNRKTQMSLTQQINQKPELCQTSAAT